MELDLPELFALDVLMPDGSWFEEAVYRSDEFIRLDDGSCVCQRGGVGTPLYLRATGRRDSVITVVAGDGPYTYRLRPVGTAGAE